MRISPPDQLMSGCRSLKSVKFEVGNRASRNEAHTSHGVSIARLIHHPGKAAWFPSWLLGLLLCIITLGGCVQQFPRQVIVFCALDRVFSESQLRAFTAQTGIAVQPKYDTESTKTVGLANQLMQPASGNVCDVFWNNEILHTLRLKRAGKLAPIKVNDSQYFPDSFQCPDGYWFGLAARARVLIVNTELLPDPETWPTSIEDLVNDQWRGRCCLAKPLFGTTATHFAVLYDRWGEPKFKAFVRGLKENQVGILSGNRQVAADVAAGKFAFGWTDTDDYHVEKLAGSPVAIVFPDQPSDPSPPDPQASLEERLGCLLLPNTIAVIKDCQNPTHAEALVAFTLAGAVETALAESPSAQIPLDSRLTVKSPLLPESGVQWMSVEWDGIVEAWDKSNEFLTAEFY